MSGLKQAFGSIHKINAPAELKFCAALIADAAETARSGDCESYVWIERCSLRWLVAIVPMEDDCERVQRALLATIPVLECDAGTIGHPMGAGTPHGSPASFRCQPSESSLFIQPLLPGLEAPHGDGCDLPEMRARTRALSRGDPLGQLETATLFGL